MAATTTIRGWPFLIARGRRRGYSVLLAPDFLIDRQGYGFLEEIVAPPPPGAVRTRQSGRSQVVWSAHPVAESDIDGDPHDEHGRPLLLLFGFLCEKGKVELDTADLDRSRGEALTTYRRFLAGEERFTIERSSSFSLRSAVTSHAASPAVASPAAPRRKAGPGVFAAGGAVVLALTIALAFVSCQGEPPAPPPPTPLVCPTAEPAGKTPPLPPSSAVPRMVQTSAVPPVSPSGPACPGPVTLPSR
jgi:hypothetical protein